jgi:predicted DNA-binding transcriptional regulator YafY
MSQLERIYAFHQKLKDNRFPNARTLAEEFELSRATAHRDINYLRDRLLAPLAFDSAKNGYYYTDDEFILPFEDSPKLLFLMGLLKKMADEAGLANLPEMSKLEKRLSQLIAPGYERLMENVLCQWIEVENLAPSIFESIIEAVLQKKLLEIRYTSASSRESERTLEPLQLINYQGSWYLLAYCYLRESHRLFHMARIANATTGDKFGKQPHPVPKSYLDDAFGIFTGTTRYQAKILFTGTAAEMVRRQHWHKNQTIRKCKEGIVLALPVADDREIIMKILQYGSMAKVLEPNSLQKRITDEATQITGLYL